MIYFRYLIVFFGISLHVYRKYSGSILVEDNWLTVRSDSCNSSLCLYKKKKKIHDDNDWRVPLIKYGPPHAGSRNFSQRGRKGHLEDSRGAQVNPSSCRFDAAPEVTSCESLPAEISPIIIPRFRTGGRSDQARPSCARRYLSILPGTKRREAWDNQFYTILRFFNSIFFDTV